MAATAVCIDMPAGRSPLSRLIGLCLAGACLETLGDPVNAAKRYDEVLADYPTSSFADTARTALRRLRQ